MLHLKWGRIDADELEADLERSARAKIEALIVDRDPWFIIALILGAALVLRLMFFTGIGSADDASIASNAIRILEGRFQVPTGHYSARVGMTFPLALIYALFGVGEWQTALIPMFSSLGGIILAFLIGRRVAGDEVGLFAAGALALFPLDVEKSSTFIPDLYLGSLLALSVFMAFVAIERERAWPWALASGLVWGGSYLVKVEAAFLLFPIVFLYLAGGPSGARRHWQAAMITCVASASVVVAENLVYFSQNGELLFRFQLIDAISSRSNAEFSIGNFWVYPKSWFLTFYNFGLHFYVLFAGAGLILYRRQRALYVPVVWMLAYVVWLQFGINPFSESWSFKSHLQRYCLMFSVPMAIIVGWTIVQLKSWKPVWAYRAGLPLLVAVSVFFMAFNQLNSEKELASKKAISLMKSEELFPAFVDTGTYAMAMLLLYGTPYRDQVHLFQEHNFAMGKTRVLTTDEMDGYLILNRDFVEYRKNRYFMESVDVSLLRTRFPIVGVVDNPSSSLSYLQIRMLGAASRLVPLPALRQKIGKTADAVLRGEDVLIFDLRKSDAE